MSSSSKSTSLNLLAPPFVVPQKYSSLLVQRVQIFDVHSDNPGLKYMGACHCYALVTLEDDQIVQLESGKNSSGKIEITYSEIDM